MSCAALHSRTALLPHVHPEAPSNGPFGRNTHDAIVNGVVYGGVGALREIVERYATELREWPQLVITGGNAPLVKNLADFVDSVVPDLCLMGVALAYRKASGQACLTFTQADKRSKTPLAFRTWPTKRAHGCVVRSGEGKNRV